MSRQVRGEPPGGTERVGVESFRPWLAPGLSALGLLIVAVITFNLLNGEAPFGIGSPGGSNGEDPTRTAAPSGVVVVPPEAAFDGTMVYAKGGNIWLQDDDDARQLTDSGKDSMPSFSADGAWVYYIQTDREEGSWVVKGIREEWQLDVPKLMRVPTDASTAPEQLADGLIGTGRNRYAYWLRQPTVSPDGTTVAIISDAPNPDEKDPVLQFMDLETGELTDPGLRTNGVLGHQDPAWRDDGKFLLFVRNARNGSRGAPVIMRYNPETGRAGALTTAGYLYPAYSPDGRYIAATRTTTVGTDVVILHGSTGEELLRVTDDGKSWAPTWSPAGDGIVFLHLSGRTVDLRLAELGGTAPSWTIDEVRDLTEVTGLGPASRPDWFIPADQLPATPPPATSAPSASPAAP